MVLCFGLFISFPTIKVRHYSSCNVLSSHICLVRFQVIWNTVSCRNRTCDGWQHFLDCLAILATTGVQGDNVSGLTMIIYLCNLPGLLMARAYAISNYHKLIVWVLGLLYIGNIGTGLVCPYIFSCYLDCLHFHDGIPQYISILDGCVPTDMQLNTILL